MSCGAKPEQDMISAGIIGVMSGIPQSPVTPYPSSHSTRTMISPQVEITPQSLLCIQGVEQSPRNLKRISPTGYMSLPSAPIPSLSSLQYVDLDTDLDPDHKPLLVRPTTGGLTGVIGAPTAHESQEVTRPELGRDE